jgi:3-hydroxybutyryl-CoA dehydrogenase
MINEAIFVLAEGIAAAEDIDRAMVLGTNQPMGPLALVDLIGLDTLLFVMEGLHKELGEDKYRAAPLLRKMVRSGRLGRKSAKGFYEYGLKLEEDIKKKK